MEPADVEEIQAGDDFAKKTLARIRAEITKESEGSPAPRKTKEHKTADELSRKGSEGYFNSSEIITEIERKQRNWVHKMLKSKTFRVSAGAAVLLGGVVMTAGGIALEKAIMENFDEISTVVIEQIKLGQYTYPAQIAALSAGAYKIGEWGFKGMQTALQEFASVIGGVVRKQQAKLATKPKLAS